MNSFIFGTSGVGRSGVGPLEMCNFETISLSFVFLSAKNKVMWQSLG